MEEICLGPFQKLLEILPEPQAKVIINIQLKLKWHFLGQGFKTGFLHAALAILEFTL